jgi:hypothetical protein
LRAERGLGESNDDNPYIVRYDGTTEAAAAWLPGTVTTQLTWRPDTTARFSQTGSIG